MDNHRSDPNRVVSAGPGGGGGRAPPSAASAPAPCCRCAPSARQCPGGTPATRAPTSCSTYCTGTNSPTTPSWCVPPQPPPPPLPPSPTCGGPHTAPPLARRPPTLTAPSPGVLVAAVHLKPRPVRSEAQTRSALGLQARCLRAGAAEAPWCPRGGARCGSRAWAAHPMTPWPWTWQHGSLQGADRGSGPERRPAHPLSSLPVLQDYSIDEEAAFQAALALSLSEN